MAECFKIQKDNCINIDEDSTSSAGKAEAMNAVDANLGEGGDTNKIIDPPDENDSAKSTHRFTCSAGGGDSEGEPNLVNRKYNDLVADLYLNGDDAAPISVPSTTGGFGDCTNIRATLDFTNDGGSSHKIKQDSLMITVSETLLSPSSSSSFTPQPATQNSSFSFKHFLNSSCTMTAPSTTVTSLDPISSSSSFAPTNDIYTSTAGATISLQTSTGARPKVPQSASISNTSISSLLSNMSIGGALDSSSLSSTTKMKRSPRFSSFDSQASLAEYAGVNSETSLDGASGCTEGSTTAFRLYLDGNNAESGDIFVPFTSGTSTLTTNSGDYERQYISRSYSNYELPPVSPRRRPCYINSTKDARRARHSLSSNSAKAKLDLPLDSAGVSTASPPRPLPINPSDFPPAPSASALPDFVQDHWMESWYAHDMHVNSTRNSPLCDFLEDPIVTLANSAMGTGGSLICGGSVNDNGNVGESSTSSKMLPDFLSDGPIIHSSGRLADVAAGLPSNSMGSPEEQPMTSQLSRLRLENERLQRELQETRAALNHQTRRTSELEQQMQEKQRDDAAYSRAMAQNMQMVEESLDKSKKKTAAAQSHITKLKQQVMQLTAEVETLRHENEFLREEGAVGGASASSEGRYAAPSASNTRTNALRPSKAHQFSRDLIKAASNAENNLRQLLAGVENLRQMAVDIENSEPNIEYVGSPDAFSDFIDDCDDYDDYSGGPAL